MPVYLFTFHAYRSWMPDHPRGYTKRGVGHVAPDEHAAENYERRAQHDATVFDVATQSRLIEHLRTIPQFIPIQLYAITTEPSHVHVLCGWDVQDRPWEQTRNSIKSSISRWLGSVSTEPPVRLARGASRSCVQTQDHFDHLMFEYLPKHSGASWFEDRGSIPARREAWEARHKRKGQ